MKVCFYDDSPTFGGHDLMAVKAAAALSGFEGWTVSFVIWHGNARLREAVSGENRAGARVSLVETSVRTRRPNPLRVLISWFSLGRTVGLLRRLAPDVVVVVQGRVEIGLAGLLAGKLAGLKTVSYLPMAHTLREMGKRILPDLRDRLNQFYYRIADRIVTISPAIEAQVRRFAPRTPVCIVENLVLAEPAARTDRMRARAGLGLPGDAMIVAMIGRVEFSQKGHDILVDAVARGGEALANHVFAVIGDGPDLERLKRMVGEARLVERFVFLPWREDMAAVYSAIDLLALPSRFEGVPLVMLDALAFGVPVVAADRDGMADWLPIALRFAPGPEAADGLRRAIIDATTDPAVRASLTPLVERLRRLADIARYAADWRRALGPGPVVVPSPGVAAATLPRD
jgi:glycosyltransferase involved in cell wall biosynthesis